MTIVLTRMDTYYNPDTSPNSSPEHMKKMVADTVKENVGARLSAGFVYPVSSSWAVNVSEGSMLYSRTSDNRTLQEVYLYVVAGISHFLEWFMCLYHALVGSQE